MVSYEIKDLTKHEGISQEIISVKILIDADSEKILFPKVAQKIGFYFENTILSLNLKNGHNKGDIPIIRFEGIVVEKGIEYKIKFDGPVEIEAMKSRFLFNVHTFTTS